MKLKLIKALLSIAAVACLSVGAFQQIEKGEAQQARSIILYMEDPGPGGG